MLLEDFIIRVYCLIDAVLKNSLGSQKLRQRGFEPNLSDGEVMTMEIVAEFLGIDTDKGAWEYFTWHWHDWFPAPRLSRWTRMTATSFEPHFTQVNGILLNLSSIVQF